MNNRILHLAAVMACLYIVIAVRNHDFSELRRHRSQRYRVHFFRSPNGKYISFINLRATFMDPEAVDVEPEKTKYDFYDFDDSIDDKDQTIISVTPMPLLETLVTPIPPSIQVIYTESTKPVPMVSEIASTSTAPTTSKVIDYPFNDQIPGIDEIKPIKIPHKIRHHHKKPNDEEQNRIELVSSTSIWSEFKDKKSFDDEDYFTRQEEEPPTTTKMDTPTTSSTINRGMEIPATTLVTPITTTTVFEIPSTSTVIAMHESQESRQKLTSIPIEDVSTIANTETFSSTTTSFNESEPFNDTSTVNETEISPREILYEDPLKRNETVLRELLTNLTHLEEVDHGASHQDYGASFLTPVLKSVSYDNNSAPIVFPDIPVNVKIALNIIHLANFDSQQMEYTVDLEMRMSWFDVRLSNNYTKPIRVREKFILDQIWRPDPYFVNSKYSYFHLVSFPNFRMRIKPNGLVTYALRATLLPACQMIFCRFPHDSQQCDLQISSIAYPKTNVNFSWYTDPVQFASKISLPELRIKSLSSEECKVEGKLISSSCLRLLFSLERDGARYIVEKYIPSTLAMMFAWVAPYVPYNYEDVRIITPITVLLTLVQMEKGDMQVRTSYLTSMDRWFAAMKAFSVISLIESLVVLALIKRSRGMEKQALRAITVYEKERYEAEKRRLTDLYHRVDGAARFLSPVVFIFYFVYYVLYIAQGDERHCITESVFKQDA